MSDAFAVEYDADQEPSFVRTADELDQLLNAVTEQAIASGVPTFVEITSGDDRRTLDIGVGAENHSTLIWYDDDAEEVLTSSGTLQAPDDAGFDYGGTWTPVHHDAIIPIQDARQAAREFVATGNRPANIGWKKPERGSAEPLAPSDPEPA